MQGAEVFNVICVDPFYFFEFSFILADASYCNTESSDEGAVGDSDVGGVGFNADAVITVIHEPIVEGYSGAVDCVRTVGIICV